ncbi:MAG: tRNA (adenosine(37)-N6)-threonylcarbamoyltransferase complex ATPase subunit type 1 TsaE [Candidatus Omnitrophica bacterium]|nr:tRNA (adenosine(37)-N6)-threonylcarbamoyltransferase complex ATPase subunit type 1 TsaE [Candidatus Omnitrophota bacterium]
MKIEQIASLSPEETKAFGKYLAKFLDKGDIVCLFGELGSGKTTLIKGIALGLDIDELKVNSPSFVLMNIYQGRLPLYHFDFYRLEDSKGIGSIGYDEFLYGDGVSVIEWADRLGLFLPDGYLKIEVKHKTFDERLISLSAINRDFKYEPFVH